MYSDDIEKMCSIIADNSDVVNYDYDGFFPLNRTVRQNSIYAIAILMKHGAKIDAKDDDGRTALHIASIKCQLGSISRLLKYVEACNNACWTAHQ